MPQSLSPMTDEGDDALMARASARDEQAFRLLIARHGERPYRTAWRMLGDQVEAEDVAQEALLRLWKQAPIWRSGEAGVGAWLARVATNLALDRLRSRKFSSDEDIPERADDSPLADVQMESDQRCAIARAAIEALPDRQRAAIILTYFEELPNAEAASALDLNIKAFESLLLRARTALRGSLAVLKGAAL